MPRYKQTVKFEKEFAFDANNASEANDKLTDLIRQTEWDADVRNDGGFMDFEDEPIECPKCKGNCEINGDTCNLCNGEGCVPFGTNYKPKNQAL